MLTYTACTCQSFTICTYQLIYYLYISNNLLPVHVKCLLFVHVSCLLSVVNGSWALWGDWSKCGNVSCHGDALYIRNRTCSSPEPRLQGADCEGESGQEAFIGKLIPKNYATLIATD